MSASPQRDAVVVGGIWLLGLVGQIGVTLTPFALVSGLLWGFRVPLLPLAAVILASFAAAGLAARMLHPAGWWRLLLWNSAALSSALLLTILVRSGLARSPFSLRPAELFVLVGAIGTLVARFRMPDHPRPAPQSFSSR